MPPKKRGRPPLGEESEDAHENPITLERIAEVVNQQLNLMMPNIITQVAQALNIDPSDRDDGSSHVVRNEEERSRNDEAERLRNEGERLRNDEAERSRNERETNVGADAKPCTFKTFTNCDPPKFTGEEGAVGLLSWFEAMESTLYHCEAREDKKVEYATSQFKDTARSWWVTIMRERGQATAYGLTWEELKRMMREEFSSKEAIQELEQEFWYLQMVGHDIDKYIQRFNELVRLVPHLATPEEKKIDRFIWGLIPEVRGGVITANPATMTAATLLAKRLSKDVARSSKQSSKTDVVDKGKKKVESTSEEKDVKGPNKKGKTVKNFAVTTTEQSRYTGSLPKCSKCNLHHGGNCPACYKCQGIGHFAKYCRAVVVAEGNGENVQDDQNGPAAGRVLALNAEEAR